MLCHASDIHNPDTLEVIATALARAGAEINGLAMLPCDDSPCGQPYIIKHLTMDFTSPKVLPDEPFSGCICVKEKTENLSDVQSIVAFLAMVENKKNAPEGPVALLPKVQTLSNACLAISPFVPDNVENICQLYKEKCNELIHYLPDWGWCGEILEDVYVVSYCCNWQPQIISHVINPLHSYAHELTPAAVSITSCNDDNRAFRIAVYKDDMQALLSAYDVIPYLDDPGCDFTGRCQQPKGLRGTFSPYVALRLDPQKAQASAPECDPLHFLKSLTDFFKTLIINGVNPPSIGRFMLFPLVPDSAGTEYAYAL